MWLHEFNYTGLDIRAQDDVPEKEKTGKKMESPPPGVLSCTCISRRGGMINPVITRALLSLYAAKPKPVKIQNEKRRDSR